jgi:hypothetical protein
MPRSYVSFLPSFSDAHKMKHCHSISSLHHQCGRRACTTSESQSYKIQTSTILMRYPLLIQYLSTLLYPYVQHSHHTYSTPTSLSSDFQCRARVTRHLHLPHPRFPPARSEQNSYLCHEFIFLWRDVLQHDHAVRQHCLDFLPLSR